MQILGSVGGIGGTHSWNCESATISESLWSTVFFLLGGGGSSNNSSTSFNFCNADGLYLNQNSQIIVFL